MNIKKVSIKNYRNFEDFEIEFSEGFQTIIGENNIGKSNLYWAIRMVLDGNLSYNSRKLELKDFHGFKNEVTVEDHVIISIDLESDNLAAFPTFHAMKTSSTMARITYLFAHQSKFHADFEIPDDIELNQFKWHLLAGGNSLHLEALLTLNKIHFRDIDGINLYYINAFRNINSDLHGNTKSLLRKYCESRDNADSELQSIKEILTESSDDLNALPFVPDVADNIQKKGEDIAGKYFSFPVAISFLSNFDSDAWNQLNLFYNSPNGGKISIQSLGLGQKNILYLSLFIAELENSSNNHEINILLIEEPEAHLHPQLQKVLFANLNQLTSTQIFMTSHSTHIASDCEFKNLNVLFYGNEDKVGSFSPFNNEVLLARESSLLKRYLDATRSEMFFSSAIIFVEGVGEQFIIPSIAEKVYDVNLTENNISVIPVHSRYFDPYLKLVQDNNFEIPVSVIIDEDELEGEESETTSVENARALSVEDRVLVSAGTKTLETDLFSDKETNASYLKTCFENLGHTTSYNNLIAATGDWDKELIKRVDKTVKKGRFAQELSALIDEDFVVPSYIEEAINHIKRLKNITPTDA